MKRIATVLMLAMLVVFASCEKETILTIDLTDLSFTDAGGSQTITLIANKPWSISASQSWCKVSPSGGEEASGSRISISCDANTSYDARSCTVTITCAEMMKTVSISQATNNGLMLSQTSYEVTKASQQLDIQVQANVNFSVDVDNACKDWIKYITTKGLTTSTVVLDIAENKTYDSREGKVTIKQDGGSLSSTVTIKQSQLDGLFITTPEYNLSNEKHTLTVEVQSNIDFEVKSEVDWIKYVETKGLKTNKIILDIAANEDYDSREGKVQVKQKNGDLSGTITVKQDETLGLFLSQTEFDLSNEAQSIDVEVKVNVDFDIVIPSDCKNWIKLTQTKSLSTKNCSFSISKNNTYHEREGSITFKQKDGPLSGTVKVKQKQTNIVTCDISDLVFDWKGGEAIVKISSNTDYTLVLPEFISKELIETSHVDYLTVDTYKFLVSENLDISYKADVSINWNSNQGEETIIIKVSLGEYSVVVENPGTLIDLIETERVGKIRGIRISGRINGTDILIIRRMTSLCHLNIHDAIIVSGGHSYYDNYESDNDVIGAYMFYNLPCLETVKLPKDVVRIGEYAFRGCENLKTVGFPEKLKYLDLGCFSWLCKLTDVHLPNTLEVIGATAFSVCTSLVDIPIPESVISIRASAFTSTPIKKVVLPKNLKSIGASCFFHCDSLEEIHVKASPSTLVDIASDLFDEETYQNATLYVPKGTKSAYYFTDFGRFVNIVEE